MLISMMISIEVAFALPDKQIIIPIQVKVGTTVRVAIEQSGILKQCADINLSTMSVGIFSHKVALDTMVNAGDRIEIYRPLLIDPKQARRKRAARQK